MKKIFFWIFILTILGTYFYVSISQNLKTERNTVTISLSDTSVVSSSLSVAVIGDVHLPEGSKHLDAFKKLVLEIKSTQPDLVVFVGDYTSDPKTTDNMSSHRKNIINIIKLIDPLPRAVVLGNYESWSDAEKWIREFNRLGVDIMENQTSLIQTVKGNVCIRGLGDKYTNRYDYVDYPEECENIPRFTITHDPAGAFNARVKGLVIAGHTHCGQISFPYIGPLWVPSDAPSEAHCGLYEDDQRTVFVTSGVGTTILPLRFGAQSQWDELNISWN
ncbi:metallophosphoesterase [Amylibacter sp.]|nr:metallophosphoesterase [Amylibacter sp.]